MGNLAGFCGAFSTMWDSGESHQADQLALLVNEAFGINNNETPVFIGFRPLLSGSIRE